MHNTRYVVLFVTMLTVVVALVLSSMAVGLKPIHERNEAIYNKKAILSALENYLDAKPSDMDDAQVQQIFDEQIEQVVIDMDGEVVGDMLAEDVELAKEEKKPLSEQKLPLYIYNSPKGKVYVTSVRGSGLWDKIWGNIALESDFSTIAGATFDHAGETPGLGAEIKDNPSFAAQFKGKKIYNQAGDYTSVQVVKGRAKDPMHEVDGISGATVTCVGVGEMLERGLEYYESYFEKIK